MNEGLDRTLHMVGGSGDTSYASNSKLQENVILEAKESLKESLSNLLCTILPKTLMVADLGCSSGANAFLVLSEVLETISDICHHSNQPLEILYIMNDLSGNDFNTLFQSARCHHKKITKEGNKVVPYYIAGVPGSFYGRLFPKESIHFIHSSYSLHWLSRVPKGLEDNEGNPTNRGNIYISKTSPPYVHESYLKQFQKDFSGFLKLRSIEMISGGQMVLTIAGRSTPQLSDLLELLSNALNIMVSEGLIQERKVDEFNLPIYTPSMEEVREIVLSEGSFDLYHAHVFKQNWDPFDDCNMQSGENVARIIRAATEPLLASHFGEEVLDPLFSKYAEVIAEHLLKEKTKSVNFTLTLSKRG